MVSFLGRTGRFALEQIAAMGKLFSFLMSALFLAFRRPAKFYLIIHHIKTIGVDSLSVVALSGFFTGMVMGFQGYYSLRKFNAESTGPSSRNSPNAVAEPSQLSALNFLRL